MKARGRWVRGRCWAWVASLPGLFPVLGEAALATESPPEVYVALISPANGSLFTQPVDLRIHALAEAPEGVIRRVEFAAGTNRLGSVSQAPYQWTWTDAPAGTYAVTAVVYDERGPVLTSTPPAVITVRDNPTNAPTFAFAEFSVAVREHGGWAALTVTNSGQAAAATVGFRVASGTALANGVDFTAPADPRVEFAAGQCVATLLVPIADDALSEGIEFFQVALTAGSAGHITNPATAIVWILDDDELATNSLTAVVRPGPVEPLGALQVALAPEAARGQWRLSWETEWHDGGSILEGLPTGNYTVEFKPVSTHREPMATAIAVGAGMVNGYRFEYTNTSLPLIGSLTVFLEPSLVTTTALGPAHGQWQLEGEADWHDSGTSVHALPAGAYRIRFAPLPGWLEPSTRTVSVVAHRNNEITAHYYVADSSPGEAPEPLTFAAVQQSCAAGLPYACAGQLLSSVGWASGFVVRERVVLTVAHAVFDDHTLSFVPEVKWFFQRHTGTYEPPPQLARGWLVDGGYAAQRQAEATPGLASVASQHLDVAALYFLAPAGRGGYGGYLVSQHAPGEWLFSGRPQVLIGYPMDHIPTPNRGKLHATSIRTFQFQQVSNQVFATSEIQSRPGMSGGSLCVQTDEGTFYPVGVCVGGSYRLVIRVFDFDSIELVTRAEQAAQARSIGDQPAKTYGPSITRPRNNPEISKSFVGSQSVLNRSAGREELDCIITLAPSDRVLRLNAGERLTVRGRYQAWGSNYLDRAGQLWAAGSSGSVYRIEYAEGLPTSNRWTLLQRITLTNHVQRVTNALQGAFYRTVLEP